MNALESAIMEAINTQGEQSKANKAYLEFLKANFIIPIEKYTSSGEPEVLYLLDGDEAFLPVFTDQEALDLWVHDIKDSIQVLKLSGVDLLKGIGDNVSVCLNIGTPYYKTFNASEIARMRSMVLKLFK